MIDISEYLDDEETIIECLNAAAQTAKEAGIGRESLYKSLSPSDNPSLGTIVKVVQSLGGRIAIEPVSA